MRGTVYLIDASGMPWGRVVFTFEASDAGEFKQKVQRACEDGTGTTLAFGPIGPPWSISQEPGDPT